MKLKELKHIRKLIYITVFIIAVTLIGIGGYGFYLIQMDNSETVCQNVQTFKLKKGDYSSFREIRITYNRYTDVIKSIKEEVKVTSTNMVVAPQYSGLTVDLKTVAAKMKMEGLTYAVISSTDNEYDVIMTVDLEKVNMEQFLLANNNEFGFDFYTDGYQNLYIKDNVAKYNLLKYSVLDQYGYTCKEK